MPPSNRRPLYTGEEVADDSVAASGTSIVEAMDGDDTAPLSSISNERVVMEQPCTFKGLASAAGAGVLGYVLGTVPAAIRHKGRQWALTHKAGTQSASQLAIMSGLYTAIHCICFRLRQHEDGWNRGIAGCATGLALGFPNGPAAALQSCLGIGAISYIIDFGTAPATAATVPDSLTSNCSRVPSTSSTCRSCSSSSSLGCATLFSPPDWLFESISSYPSTTNSSKGNANPAAAAISSMASIAAEMYPVGGALQAPLAWLAHACQEHIRSINATSHRPSYHSTSSSSSGRCSNSSCFQPSSWCEAYSACEIQPAGGRGGAAAACDGGGGGGIDTHGQLIKPKQGRAHKGR